MASAIDRSNNGALKARLYDGWAAVMNYRHSDWPKQARYINLSIKNHHPRSIRSSRMLREVLLGDFVTTLSRSPRGSFLIFLRDDSANRG